eukprot:Protomagalhaensia_wolfi_Nauph_80__329@NODE_1184_length_1671_cov_149_034926_g908_i0_p2_GENE_NODE_1184_length_1671_cov_149_034926_g908_i0NODE_1184_length_1671_cov_149_034926_g908_i0_p2_ORF_typecomplete_len151_score26_36RhlB/PF12300_8/0_21Stm1_N/PF09598_10/6_9_NODE_1184_length_1671_cov_149_034926_g908_i09441396
MSEPFIKRLSAETNRLGATLTEPATRFVRHFIYNPLYKLVYYNDSVEKFAAAHPGLFALGIVFTISLILLALVHLLHLLILGVWGGPNSKWHEEEITHGRRPKTQPKKRASTKEAAKTAKAAAKEAAKSAKEAKEAKEPRPRRRRKDSAT